jgi:hypothetical protein
MSSKSAQSAYTAGIFADMSLDGPEIGTLVAVIDRARNLPNRKTMGKQDPYCAMRLGKEAKKTETDRRGGQTPKWDQEIRFTVHESPDYYKLKCSVFNDDKKTDLIGESWVDLKEVVVPGGGQNDLWHQLQFKGKYAGEIRMELTYYDTRPKDETVLEKRREKTRNNSQSTAAGSEVGSLKHLGPRDIKRRPLPPSPASSSPSQNPLREPALPTQQPPQTYEQAVVPRSQLPMAHFGANGSNHSSLQYQQVQHYAEPHQQPHDHDYDDLQPYEEPAPNHEYTQSIDPGYLPFDSPSGHSQYNPQPVRQPWEEEERTMSSEPSPSSQRWSSPSSIPPSVQPTDPRTTANFNRYSTSPVKNVPFRDSPLRQSISHHEVADEPDHALEAEDLRPPPPPAHRQSSAASISMTNGTPNIVTRAFPAYPLDARSPLQAIERSYDSYRSSPTTQQHHNAIPNPLHSRTNHISEDHFRHSTGTYTANSNRSVAPPPRSSSYDTLDRCEDPRAFQDEFQRHSRGLCNMQDPHERNMPHPPPRSSKFDERHVYASSPPVFRPRAVSPNAPRHQIARRSVSPNASVGGRESLSGVPFGPDAYEEINPVRSSPASTHPQSPAEAMEEARQKEVERLRDLGPIIGNDGREIDPTDHLPSDTWAPEPERKNRKPEVVIRFKTKDEMRRTPASSPASVRPQSYAGYASSPTSMHAESPSTRNGRNRLQKQAPSRPLPAQPYQHANSSPAVPQQLTPTRRLPTQPFQHPNSSPSVPMAQRQQTHATPPRKDPSRPALSEYSVNSDHVHSSPLRQSPYDNITLPPVPAKIPLHVQDQYRDHSRAGSYDSLSAELSSIDIGPSRGGRTGLRSSRGYGY